MWHSGSKEEVGGRPEGMQGRAEVDPVTDLVTKLLNFLPSLTKKQIKLDGLSLVSFSSPMYR